MTKDEHLLMEAREKWVIEDGELWVLDKRLSLK